MVTRYPLILLVCLWSLLLADSSSTANTQDCSSIRGKTVKVEAWMSKQYEKNLRQIRNEFSAMGNTQVTLWVYPAKNPSKIVAIGSCVPAYIGRHMIRRAIEYSGGVSSLVNQVFFFVKLDRNRDLSIFRKFFSTSHTETTNSAHGCFSGHSTVSKNLPSTYQATKKGKGLWSFVK